MTGRVYIDFETKSEADLGIVGAWEYSKHPSTEVIVLCYRIRTDGAPATPVQHWTFQSHGGSMPGDLRAAIEKGYEVARPEKK